MCKNKYRRNDNNKVWIMRQRRHTDVPLSVCHATKGAGHSAPPHASVTKHGTYWTAYWCSLARSSAEVPDSKAATCAEERSTVFSSPSICQSYAAESGAHSRKTTSTRIIMMLATRLIVHSVDACIVRAKANQTGAFRRFQHHQLQTRVPWRHSSA